MLEATFVVHVLRPYSTHRPTEIIAAPKVYGFDTGFVCYHRGWHELRSDDLGLVWEHFVLNEMHARLQSRDVRYWRDKRGHEVDFILPQKKRPPVAIECKWSSTEFDPANLQALRKIYPHGDNLVVANDVERSFTRTYYDLSVKFVSLAELIPYLQSRQLPSQV